MRVNVSRGTVGRDEGDLGDLRFVIVFLSIEEYLRI